MASRAEVEQVRRALNRLAEAAQADWQAVWDSLRASDRALVSRAMANGWVWVLERYGDMAATLAADYFEVEAARLGLRKSQVKMAPGVDERRATARLGWALTTPNSMANMVSLIDQLVKQPYRSTMQDSAWASGAGWARVPSGSETCAFCLMLASRGGVYKSQATAGDRRYGKEYHGECDCTVVLVRDESDYPQGYDPDGLYDQYNTAANEALGRSPRSGRQATRAILAALRRGHGIH